VSGRRSRGAVFAREAGVVLRALVRAGHSRAEAVTAARDPAFVEQARREGAERAAQRMPERLEPPGKGGRDEPPGNGGRDEPPR
jgi:hypothetical protein